MQPSPGEKRPHSCNHTSAGFSSSASGISSFGAAGASLESVVSGVSSTTGSGAAALVSSSTFSATGSGVTS
uniref:Uncharacterized protein n=1 Tax=Nelumbo nucifera TaxID=4432 RepID=A0A822XS54_NELNU|nr:TPA_asm: hypothetical protein HUJ06_021782 [Nelumbo nucifera]